jgi:hypothetical protein
MARFVCKMKNTYTYFFGERVKTGNEFQSNFDLTGSTSTSKDGSITITTHCQKK